MPLIEVNRFEDENHRQKHRYDQVKSDLYRIFSPDPQPPVAFMKRLAQEYGLPNHLALLDIGIGTGAAVPHYAQHGWTVTAYEPDDAFANRAYEEMKQHQQPMIIKRGGFLDIDEAASVFDMVVAINAPFAYLKNEYERLEALRLVHTALKKDGVFLMEIPNVLWFLRNKSEIELTEKTFQNVGRARNYRSYDFDLYSATMVMQNDYYVLEDCKIAMHISEKHTLAVLKLPEVKYLLTENGFGEVRVFPNYATSKNSPDDCTQLIMSAKKMK